MIWYVARRAGAIVATYSEIKPGVAEEAVDGQTSPELQAYFQGPDLSDSDTLEKALKAVLLAAGQMAGKTPAQTRAAFKTAWQAL